MSITPDDLDEAINRMFTDEAITRHEAETLQTFVDHIRTAVANREKARIEDAATKSEEIRTYLRTVNPHDQAAKAEFKRLRAILTEPEAIAIQNGWKEKT